jgi:hypothetical protein
MGGGIHKGMNGRIGKFVNLVRYNPDLVFEN